MTTYRLDPYQKGTGPSQKPYGGPVWYQDPEKIDSDVEVERVILDVVNNTKKLRDFDISQILIDGEIFQTMDGASTITLTLHDPEMELLRTGAFSRAIDINIDGLWYRLVGLAKNDDYLDLTFEDRIIVWLKGKKEVKRASRAQRTRLEFCYSLVRTVKKKIPVVIPELRKKQEIGPTDNEREDVKSRTSGGLNQHEIEVDSKPPSTVARSERFIGKKDKLKRAAVTVKGRPANKVQMRVLEGVLRTGADMGVSKKLLLAAVEVVIQESLAGMENVSISGKHVGPFHQQVAPSVWSRRGGAIAGNSDKAVRGGAKAFFLAAQEKDKEFITVEGLAEAVQVAGTPTAWGQWRQEAEQIVSAFTGDKIDEEQPTRTYRKRYLFSTENGGKRENYWAAIKRLLDEVNFACFTSNGILYMISMPQLMKSKIRMVFSVDTPGVNDIDFDWDTNKKVATCTVHCRITRWAAPPGTVVRIKDCGPLSDGSGRWLVESIRRSLFSRDAEITLIKPEPILKEPAPEVGTRPDFSTDEELDGPAGVRGDLAYPLSKIGTFLGGVAAHMTRAWGDWQSDNAMDIGVPKGTDVYAVASGQITKLGGSWNGGAGNPDGFNVTLRTKDNEWFYTHLMKRDDLEVGQWVKKGEHLGKSGAANGKPHLHIACKKGDPERLLRS